MRSETLYSGCKDVVACDIADGIALLDLRESKYYKLNPTGALLWSEMTEPKTVDQLVAAVSAQFEVEPEVCARDIEAMLASLEQSQLIKVKVAERE